MSVARNCDEMSLALLHLFCEGKLMHGPPRQNGNTSSIIWQELRCLACDQHEGNGSFDTHLPTTLLVPAGAAVHIGYCLFRAEWCRRVVGIALAPLNALA